jgi:hypothetical protein
MNFAIVASGKSEGDVSHRPPCDKKTVTARTLEQRVFPSTPTPSFSCATVVVVKETFIMTMTTSKTPKKQ